jgi:hypothetical protein
MKLHEAGDRKDEEHISYRLRFNLEKAFSSALLSRTNPT